MQKNYSIQLSFFVRNDFMTKERNKIKNKNPKNEIKQMRKETQNIYKLMQ